MPHGLRCGVGSVGAYNDALEQDAVSFSWGRDARILSAPGLGAPQNSLMEAITIDASSARTRMTMLIRQLVGTREAYAHRLRAWPPSRP